MEDDSPRVQALIDQALAAGKRHVMLRGGSYTLRTPLVRKVAIILWEVQIRGVCNGALGEDVDQAPYLYAFRCTIDMNGYSMFRER